MVELTLRVFFSLAVVLGLLWFVARASSRRLGGRARSMVRVVARQPLSRSASLAVVEVGERVLVVGVSENGVRLLTEMDPSELPEPLVERATTPVALGDVPAGVPSVAPIREASAGLGGSLLSTQTWRQAWTAATSRNGTTGD